MIANASRHLAACAPMHLLSNVQGALAQYCHGPLGLMDKASDL